MHDMTGSLDGRMRCLSNVRMIMEPIATYATACCPIANRDVSTPGPSSTIVPENLKIRMRKKLNAPSVYVLMAHHDRERFMRYIVWLGRSRTNTRYLEIRVQI